jgi:hypothetical protein
MRRSLLSAAFLAVAALGSAHAHHSRAAFDLGRSVVLDARITEVRWTNPHVFYIGEVVDQRGQKEEWTFEGHSISGLTRQGWSKDTLKVGDRVQIVVNRHRDPQKKFALIDHVRLADGRMVYSLGKPLPDDSVAAEPSKDFSGNWQFKFPGTPEEVRRRVLLGAGGPPADLPYTPKGRAQAAAYDANKNPTYTCEPVSLPTLLMAVYQYKWIREPDRIVIRKEHFDNADRVVHLKQTAPPRDYQPNPLGFSVGRFEADGTLVIETTGFSPVRWGSVPGVDSSDKKRIVERYKLIEGGRAMSLSYTMEDTEYFTGPFTRSGTFVKKPDSDFAPQPPCDLGTAQQHLQFGE